MILMLFETDEVTRDWSLKTSLFKSPFSCPLLDFNSKFVILSPVGSIRMKTVKTNANLGFKQRVLIEIRQGVKSTCCLFTSVLLRVELRL